MASSKTEIANLALSHLGIGKEIGNIDTEKSSEASAIRRFFDIARDQALRDFWWPFAKRYTALGLVEESPNDEWGYSYRYPSDALAIRKVLSGIRNDTRQSRVTYEIASDDNGRLIYTDEEDANIKYTALITDVAHYPSDFVQALALRLASYTAPRLTDGDPFGLRETTLRLYIAELGFARSNAVNEEQPDEEPASEYIRFRDGGSLGTEDG